MASSTPIIAYKFSKKVILDLLSKDSIGLTVGIKPSTEDEGGIKIKPHPSLLPDLYFRNIDKNFKPIGIIHSLYADDILEMKNDLEYGSGDKNELKLNGELYGLRGASNETNFEHALFFRKSIENLASGGDYDSIYISGVKLDFGPLRYPVAGVSPYNVFTLKMENAAHTPQLVFELSSNTENSSNSLNMVAPLPQDTGNSADYKMLASVILGPPCPPYWHPG